MPSATAKHASAVAVRRRLSSGMQSLQPRGLGFEIRLMVGGRGHYLNSRIDLGGGVLDLIRTHCDRLE